MNISNNQGRLLVINCFLLMILFFYGFYCILPKDLFSKETVTGLKYRKIFSDISEENNDYSDKEEGFFLIERKVTYGKCCLEYPLQFFYIDNHYPYIVDVEEIKNNHVWNRYFELLFIMPVGCEYEAKIPIRDIYPISKIERLKLETNMDVSPESIVTINVKKLKYYSEQNMEQISVDYIEMLDKKKQKHVDILSNKIIKDLYVNGIKYDSIKKNNGYLVCIQDKGSGGKIKKGDAIYLQYQYYKHYRDGKVYSTNIEDVAKKNDIYDDNILYEPYKLHIGERTIPCFDIILMDEDLDLCSGARVMVYDFTHSQFFGDMENIVVIYFDIYKPTAEEDNSLDDGNDSDVVEQNEKIQNEELKDNEQRDDKNYVTEDENIIEDTQKTSPEEDNISQEEAQTSPEEDNISQEEDQASPEEDQTSQEEDQASPEEDQASPEEDQTSQEEDKTSQEEDNISPAEDNISPEDDDKASYEDDKTLSQENSDISEEEVNSTSSEDDKK